MKDFKQLLASIEQIHHHLQAEAVKAVNQMLTIRNWLIGHYIVEFEQNGEDRAKYGERLMESLNTELKSMKGIDRRSLFRFRTFYLMYPHLELYLVKTDAVKSLPITKTIVGTPTPQSLNQKIVGTLNPHFKNRELEIKFSIKNSKILTIILNG